MDRGATPPVVGSLPRIERLAVAATAGLALGFVLFAGARGLGLPVAPAAAVAIAALAAAIAGLLGRLPAALDGFLARRPAASAAWVLLALFALGQTARLAEDFAALDPAPRAGSPRHSCLTASTEAVRFWRAGEPNLYRAELYLGRVLAGYHVDPYFYPPPALLAPIAMLGITRNDFARTRAIWFAVNALALLLAFAACAAGGDAAFRLRLIGVAPALWSAVPVQLGLQMSNPQALVIGLAVTAWAVLPRRPAAGGGLLALAASIKLFPALLLVDLAVRRRGRAVAWTLAALAALGLAALALLGAEPFRAFVAYQLPRLESGEACAREFASPFAVARNLSPLGLPSRLALFGVPGMTLALGAVVAKLYGLAVLALAAFAAWRARGVPDTASGRLAHGLALLALGSLSGPYAPSDYAPLAVLALLCFDPRLVRPWLAIAISLLTFVPFLPAREDPAWLHALAHTPLQLLAIVVPVLVLLRRPQAEAVAAGPGLARPGAS